MSSSFIRTYQHGDHVAIATIFCRAVHEIGCKDYTPAQCLAWSDTKPNPEHWEKRCERKQPFVSVVGEEIAGFLELDPDGHIDCAYVNPDFQRRGIMTALVQHAVDVAAAMNLSRVYVEASIGARCLFERLGFEVLREQEVAMGGEKLVNYAMELALVPTKANGLA
ncbi:GNAT family N-acetyltransferase [Luteolibacter arcticus]|uniref:GNAT family N-acetyltransferase n=1 Tax=Luteolibacter arcticus TaxID=1581411 RepID=A0ABT3GE23_9BACT|nr:GNAT family N-acetyltransferase [Luteolibacter arcticus]MCW1921867.1 GNAT family N-acetyltransferase [Luteolibacter arcticus]